MENFKIKSRGRVKHVKLFKFSKYNRFYLKTLKSLINKQNFINID